MSDNWIVANLENAFNTWNEKMAEMTPMMKQYLAIKEKYPDAAIIKEAFTGTKIYERKEFSKLLNTVKSGDTIVFDSVSRMSRTADDGVKLYNELFGKGIELVFLKEPYINTEAYTKALNRGIEKIGNVIADIYIEATNEVIQLLADNQIRIAFEQAEKEVQLKLDI